MIGDFVYKVTHPKHEITKTYTVTLMRNHTKRRSRSFKKWGRYRRICHKKGRGKDIKNR